MYINNSALVVCNTVQLGCNMSVRGNKDGRLVHFLSPGNHCHWLPELTNYIHSLFHLSTSSANPYLFVLCNRKYNKLTLFDQRKNWRKIGEFWGIKKHNYVVNHQTDRIKKQKTLPVIIQYSLTQLKIYIIQEVPKDPLYQEKGTLLVFNPLHSMLCQYIIICTPWEQYSKGLNILIY